MTPNITIDASPRASNEEESSESSESSLKVQVSPPSENESHGYHEPYDEWASLVYPEPRNISSKPRTRRKHRDWPVPSASGVNRRDIQGRYQTITERPCNPLVSNASRPTNKEDWLISSGDNDKDITTHLNLNVALDLETDLETLARLNRLGHFRQGIRLFEERLASHVDFFPVVAEYADLLLEQGNFKHLYQFISTRLMDPHVRYLDEEVLLLETLKAFAEIHTKGALIPALDIAKKALSHYSLKRQGRREAVTSPGLQSQLIEICVRIIAYARTHSNFLSTELFHSLLHWSFLKFGKVWLTYFDDRNDGSHHTGLPGNNSPDVGDWYRFLLQGGFFWDAHRTLRAILPMLGGQNGQYIPEGRFEDFAQLKDISEAVDVFLQPEGVRLDDEQLILAEIANATILAEFLNVQRPVEKVRVAYDGFCRRSRSLASTILLEYPHLVNTQPYSYWLLLESIRGFPASRQLPRPINQSRLVPEMSIWNTFDRLQFLHQENPTFAGTAGQTEATKEFPLKQSLEPLLESARELGNYRLERSALEQILQHLLDWDQNLQTVRRLSLLNYDTMNDACGYLKCLITEFFVLENHKVPDGERLRRELHGRFSAFDSSFPFRFDYDTAVHQSSDIVFFDNPLMKHMERKVLCLLLGDIGRNREAELVRLQLSQVDHHLPRDFQTQPEPTGMDSGHTEYIKIKSTRTPKSARYEPPGATSRPSDIRRDGPRRVPRAILQDAYCSEDAADDTRLSLEKLIRKGRDAERAKETEDFIDREKKAMKHERLKLTEEIARFKKDLQSAGEKTRVAEATPTPLVTLKDSVGRAFLLPFNQCRPFDAMEELMQQVFRSDSILAPHIAKGNYRLTNLDGNPITRDSWDSDIQPGGTIMVHITPDLGQTLSQEPEKANTEHDQPVEGERLTAQLESVNIEDPEDKQDQGPRVDDVSDSST